MYSTTSSPVNCVQTQSQTQQQQQLLAEEGKKWTTLLSPSASASSLTSTPSSNRDSLSINEDTSFSFFNPYNHMQYPYANYTPYASPAMSTQHHHGFTPGSFNFNMNMQQSIYSCSPAQPFLLPSTPYYSSSAAAAFPSTFITPPPPPPLSASAIGPSTTVTIGSTNQSTLLPPAALLTPSPSSSSTASSSKSTPSSVLPKTNSGQQQKEDAVESAVGEVVLNKKPANLWCKICNMDIRKNRKRSQGPRRHILQFHLKQPIYFCPYCSFSSHYDKFHVNSHMSRIHKGQPQAKIIENTMAYEEHIDRLFDACFNHPLNSIVGAEMRKLHEQHELNIAANLKRKAEERARNEGAKMARRE